MRRTRAFPAGYQNLETVARLVKGSLRVIVVFAVLLAGINGLYAWARNDSLSLFREVTEAAQWPSWILWAAYQVTFVTTVVLWLLWQYGTGNNASLLNRDLTVGWGKASVWWWFVPLVNFVWPFRAIARHYRSATGRRMPTVMILWWVESVLALLLLAGAFTYELTFETFSDYTVEYYLLSGVGALANAVAAAFAVSVVNLVTTAQRLPTLPAAQAA